MTEHMKIRVGHKLLSIREERKLSQADVADLLNMSPSAYARLERGETSIEFEKLHSFAETLKVPLHELLPESFSISNHGNSGQGGSGGLVMGSFYYYGNTDTRLTELEIENKFLKEKIALLEEHILLLKDKK